MGGLPWRRQEEEKLYEIFGRDQLLAITLGQTPVSLDMARRIAFRLGISLFDLVSGNGGNPMCQRSCRLNISEDNHAPLFTGT